MPYLSENVWKRFFSEIPNTTQIILFVHLKKSPLNRWGNCTSFWYRISFHFNNDWHLYTLGRVYCSKVLYEWSYRRKPLFNFLSYGFSRYNPFWQWFSFCIANNKKFHWYVVYCSIVLFDLSCGIKRGDRKIPPLSKTNAVKNDIWVSEKLGSVIASCGFCVQGHTTEVEFTYPTPSLLFFYWFLLWTFFQIFLGLHFHCVVSVRLSHINDVALTRPSHEHLLNANHVWCCVNMIKSSRYSDMK